MSTQRPSIVFTGGGTAGHVSPLIALADAVRELAPDSQITMIGTEQGMESQLVPAAGYQLETIPKANIPRAITPKLAKVPTQLARAVSAAKRILRKHDADVVVGVGGYVSGPTYLAAKSLGIPVIVHEGNVRAGITNRVAARWAHSVFTAFPETPIRGAQLVGMPVRSEITEFSPQDQRERAREAFGLDPQLPTLVITGGSSGAARINSAAAQIATKVAALPVQVLHITGAGKAVMDQDGKPLQSAHYRQVEYVSDMAQAYAAADLLLGRSGANTVAEVATVGLPSIFVPLPIGNGEQELNARSLVESGAALLVADSRLDGAWLEENALTLLQDPERLDAMRKASELSPHRDAASTVAKAILAAATQPLPNQAHSRNVR